MREKGDKVVALSAAESTLLNSSEPFVLINGVGERTKVVGKYWNLIKSRRAFWL